MSIDAEALAGALTVRPGQALPNIVSTRREWAPQIARGQPPQRLPPLLASVYTLCGDAHRVASQHAVAAASAMPLPTTAEDREALRADTLREHLRRIWLDWPRPLAHDEPQPARAAPMALAACPLLHDAHAVEASLAWIEAEVLGMPAAAFVQQWEAAPQAFAGDWAARGETLPARWLGAARSATAGLHLLPAPLAAHASLREVEHLADQLRRDEGFALAPLWRGRTAETGPWTRLADRCSSAPAVPYLSVFMRLASRVADIARLAAPGGEHWLAQGSMQVAAHEGIGWCEMARGLLMHWVVLDDAPAADGGVRVRSCRVLAPTEWNFHPFGAVARLLAGLPPHATAAQVRLLATAFDPCVSVRIETPAAALQER